MSNRTIIIAENVIEPVVVEAEPERDLEIDNNDTTLLKHYIEDLEKKISKITKLLKKSEKMFKDSIIENKNLNNTNNKNKLKIKELDTIIMNSILKEKEHIKTIDKMNNYITDQLINNPTL
tara:strand:- start:93 stop:455 length:363 start_codon:yes stop_codon:yes gene_type:complete